MVRKNSNKPNSKLLKRGFKPSARRVFALAVIIVALSSWAWWHYVYSNPVRVFSGMLSNNLKTFGFTDQVQESNGVQGLNQTIQLVTTPWHVARASTVLSQSGGTDARVATETIGTPYTDYVRYVEVDTAQTNTAGKQLDFSKVKNVWGKTESDPRQRETTGELYNQSVLAVVPTGNLPAKERKALIDQIHNKEVYKIDYGNVQKQIKNGRPYYTYNVSVDPSAYVSILKDFAAVLGLNQLENIDPASYEQAPDLNFQLSIDAWTRQLGTIKYVGSDRLETFSAYGARRPVVFPKETIAIEELQTRIQSLQ